MIKKDMVITCSCSHNAFVALDDIDNVDEIVSKSLKGNGKIIDDDLSCWNCNLDHSETIKKARSWRAINFYSWHL